jgi:phosphatidate cytidylyltransferase
MKTRTITGIFFVIVMLASLLTGHYPFGAFYLFLGLFCQYEFYGLIKKSGYQPNYAAGLVNGALIYGAFAYITYSHAMQPVLLLVPVTLSAVFIQELFKKSATPFQ